MLALPDRPPSSVTVWPDGIVPVKVLLAPSWKVPVPALSASVALISFTGLPVVVPPLWVNVPELPELSVSDPLLVIVPAAFVHDDAPMTATTADALVVTVPLFVVNVPRSWRTSVLVMVTVPVAAFVTGTRR